MMSKDAIKRIRTVLFIGPLPPPIDGQSKATAATLTALQNAGINAVTININRNSLSRSLTSQLLRFFDILIIYHMILKRRNKADQFYLSLSESTLGNIKDILIYILLGNKISGLTIQMLGGTGMNLILKRDDTLSSLNKHFMAKMAGVIVEGKRGVEIFSNAFDRDRIHVVENFADEYLHASQNEVDAKFETTEKISILYLSNMIIEKGYLDLLSAFKNIPTAIKDDFTINFVGGFPDEKAHSEFLSAIKDTPSINYLGKFIDGEAKRRLYLSSHIFCLPTYYPYEGQPISILEAYATGCAVLTTNHGGITDIFTDQVNGYEVRKNSPESITDALVKARENMNQIRSIANHNRFTASTSYRISRYQESILDALNRSNKEIYCNA